VATFENYSERGRDEGRQGADSRQPGSLEGGEKKKGSRTLNPLSRRSEKGWNQAGRKKKMVFQSGAKPNELNKDVKKKKKKKKTKPLARVVMRKRPKAASEGKGSVGEGVGTRMKTVVGQNDE